MHEPVLKKEVIDCLDPKPNENFIDCTIGEAGHTLAILKKNGPNGKVLGIDHDIKQIEKCRLKLENFKKRVILVSDNFSNLKNIVERVDFKQVSGILLDLGMSSWHLGESKKGFSFQKNEPLDMRYNTEVQRLTAEMIVNGWDEARIKQILKDYGQEQFADKIVRKIIELRRIKPIKTTFQLVDIIKNVTPRWYQHKKIHFATRTFQALRIAVNDELNNIEKTLPQTIEILENGGRLAVISFHSLEDRIVKSFFRENYKKGHLKILTKKPIIPAEEELTSNPRSRSAKLRCAEITQRTI